MDECDGEEQDHARAEGDKELFSVSKHDGSSVTVSQPTTPARSFLVMRASLTARTRSHPGLYRGCNNCIAGLNSRLQEGTYGTETTVDGNDTTSSALGGGG